MAHSTERIFKIETTSGRGLPVYSIDCGAGRPFTYRMADEGST